MRFKKQMTWILIADGARAHIVANEGPGKGLKTIPGQNYTGINVATRELGTDRPGRTFDRAGGGRHSMENRVDWHRFEKHKFAQSMAKVLDKAADKGVFDRLILVAPPDTLGKLRSSLGKLASSRVVAELAKDLTNLSIHDLPENLSVKQLSESLHL